MPFLTFKQMQILQPTMHAPLVTGALGPGLGLPIGGGTFFPQPTLNPFPAVPPGMTATTCIYCLGFPLGLVQPTLSSEQLEDVLPEDQKELLAQVMKLTPEQIEKLPPHEQAQILQLRQTMLSLNYRR
jgi:hypothetical protein